MSGAYEAINVVGGVVPPALLGRVQSGEVTNTESITPSSYHLIGGETVRDAASRSWGYLKSAWQRWREIDAQKQGPAGVGTGDARQRWLLVLFRELGYGQVPAAGGRLSSAGVPYPVSHVWESVPIHLLGPRVELDKKNPGVEGAARAPQAMLQEFLNREEDYLWGFLSNGLKLHLLRDSTALAGSAYLEFDLETIFESELYPEFQLLWQVCHQSRLEKRGGPEEGPGDCWLEIWRGEAVDAGTRALDKLGLGVETALQALGTGFLRHPDNLWLVEALGRQEITNRDFHKALLRLAYRMLFCFVVEDRQALLDPDAPAAARERYNKYFSTQRLRNLARVRDGGPHPDLWRTQKMVLSALGGNGLAQIAVPALGGLFDPDVRASRATNQPHPDLLLGAELSNQDFLRAIRSLSWVRGKAERIQPVDYRHLGAEEFGSVYESLLELIPQIELQTRTFTLERLAGNERKVTGSYYTPPGLISALLDTALDPLIDGAVAQAADPTVAEQRLLGLTVCDPASGSGGFLVAAARRIARRLAYVRSDEGEPTPQAVQHALHDVIGRCIYGVDMNDLAAELAKVSLWLESMEPGKPLGFLDARVKIGNSLMGTTPAMLAAGVPDAAFKEIEGDEKKLAAEVRKRNKQENSRAAGGSFASLGQETLSIGGTIEDVAKLISRRQELLEPVESVAEARARADAYEEFDSSNALAQNRLHANAWTAAFVWPLRAGEPEPPTSSIVRQFGEFGEAAGYEGTAAKIQKLAQDYKFFHWHLEFPEIFGDPETGEPGPDGWPGGFTCVIGNPPWEHIELKEQEFFAGLDPEIAAASGASRKRLIQQLADTDPILESHYRARKRELEGLRHFASASGRYPLTARGRIKTDPLFAALFRSLTSPIGRTGIIVPTGIATDATTQYFFKDLLDTGTIAALYDFENRALLFDGVDSRAKFCLLTMAGRNNEREVASFAFFLHDPQDINTSSFALAPDEIKLLNPNTGTLPIFRTRRDAEITLGIYRRIPVLIDENDPVNGNPWGVSFMQGLFNMTSDSHLFYTREQLESDGWHLTGNTFERTSEGRRERMLPLYEAKMLDRYDHRSADVVKSATAQKRQNQPRYLTAVEHADRGRCVIPNYWVAAEQLPVELGSFLTGFSNVTSATNQRTVLSAALPIAGVGHSYPLFRASCPLILVAILNSIALDYVAKQKIAGLNMTYGYVKQFPIPSLQSLSAPSPWDHDTSVLSFIDDRVQELVYTSDDIAAVASESDAGEPFIWDEERRSLLLSELDACMLVTYGLDRDSVLHILDSFAALRDAELLKLGEFRTKRLVVEVFDVMQTAIDNGTTYQTILDPPPGQGPRHPAKEQV